jgi:rubrerythrin
LEDGDVFASDPHNTNSARERALQVALAAELNARKFYSGIATATTDTKLRRLYKELAEFETDHVEFLERKVSQTAAGNDQTT